MCHPLTTKPTLMQLKIQFITLPSHSNVRRQFNVFKGVHYSRSLQGRMLNLRWFDLILDSHGSIFWATKLLGITYVKYQIIGLQTSNQLYLRCRSRCHDTLLQDIGCFSPATQEAWFWFPAGAGAFSLKNISYQHNMCRYEHFTADCNVLYTSQVPTGLWSTGANCARVLGR